MIISQNTFGKRLHGRRLFIQVQQACADRQLFILNSETFGEAKNWFSFWDASFFLTLIFEKQFLVEHLTDQDK